MLAVVFDLRRPENLWPRSHSDFRRVAAVMGYDAAPRVIGKRAEDVFHRNDLHTQTTLRKNYANRERNSRHRTKSAG